MNDNQIKKIEHFLKAVNSEIKKSEEIARLKGEKFNIFSILGIETKENLTHSNFIAALLNPRGEHGLGSKFLNLFYETLLQAIPENGSDNSESIINPKEIIQALKNEIATVKTEFSLGKVDYGNTEGGRVDIAISGDGGRIFIENKIYAGDQYQQIARYNNSNQNTIVFYLTLDGKSPDKSSSGKLKENQDFFLLSYRDDIKNWLEKCLKEASDFPIVRETIKQYLILIKKLTGQLTIQIKMEDIKKLIADNYESAVIIANNIENARKLLLKKLFDKMQKKLIDDLGSSWEINISDFEQKWAIGFSVKEKTWKDILIGWSGNPFLYKPQSQTVIGIKLDKKFELRSLMEDLISKKPKYKDYLTEYNKSTDGWIAFKVKHIVDDDYKKLSSSDLLFESFSNEYVNEIHKLALIVDKMVKDIRQNANT